MEIGTLLSVGYNIIRFLANLDPQKLGKALQDPNYEYTKEEIAMIKVAREAFKKEFPESAFPQELCFKGEAGRHEPMTVLPQYYPPDYMMNKLGSNEIASFCEQAIYLIVDTINELNKKVAGDSDIEKAKDLVFPYGRINDAFRMLCVFMMGGFVELSKANFQNITELQTAHKFLNFVEALKHKRVLKVLNKFPCLISGKSVIEIWKQVVKKSEAINKQVTEGLEKTNIYTEIGQLNNLIGPFINSHFCFYSLVISLGKHTRPQIDLPDFSQREDWSPHEKWLQDLALSLALSNKFLKYNEKSVQTQSYIMQYKFFEETLLDKDGSFNQWPALSTLKELKENSSGLYAKARSQYQEYGVLGQRLYLMSLLRSSLYYFKQLAISHGEKILDSKEGKRLIENILKQMISLVTSIKASKEKLVVWGKNHYNELLDSVRSLGDFHKEEREWEKNFRLADALPDEVTELLKYLETFQKKLSERPIDDKISMSFDSHRIIKIVEVVNIHLKPGSQPIFRPIEPDEAVPEDETGLSTENEEPPFIVAVRSWIDLFKTHLKQDEFLEFWEKICYLNKSLSVTTHHCIERKLGYFLTLSSALNSPEEEQRKWANKHIMSLFPEGAGSEITCADVINERIEYHKEQLKAQAIRRRTLDQQVICQQALRLIELLAAESGLEVEGAPQKPNLGLVDAQNYIRIFYDCSFLKGFSYETQTSLSTDTGGNSALKKGLNTLLGETLTIWLAEFSRENGQPAYYELIAKGLVRLGANPLAWLKANQGRLIGCMGEKKYNPLFVFFSAQTRVFLAFIQYHAAYLGQTLTRLERMWGPFIKAIDEFSISLQACIESDDATMWRWTEPVWKFVFNKPTNPEKTLGARRERFSLWIEAIVWTYQLLNETLINMIEVPDLTDPELNIQAHAAQIKSEMDAYAKVVSEKWLFLNEGLESFKKLKEEWGKVNQIISTIANERKGYQDNLDNKRRVDEAEQKVQKAYAESAVLKMEINEARAKSAVLKTEINEARAESAVLKTEVNKANAKAEGLGLAIKNTASRLLTKALSAVQVQKKSCTKEEEFLSVIDLIYSNPVYEIPLETLLDAGWTKEHFRDLFETLLKQETELSKGKDEAVDLLADGLGSLSVPSSSERLLGQENKLNKKKEEAIASSKEERLLPKQPKKRAVSWGGLQFFDEKMGLLTAEAASLSVSSSSDTQQEHTYAE